LAVLPLHGQSSPTTDAVAQAQKKTLTDAASAGAPLPVTINVADTVNVEAVMLPREISRRVFGKHVADNYAVIEVNISNRSKDAALILQSLFIDMSTWGFAGPLGSGVGAAGLSDTTSPRPFQANASSTVVASVEYRIVRGQLLDAQPWNKRNIGLRAIQVMGSIGTAFAFPFSRDVVTGIGAWNGSVIPGYQALFPDGMEGQLNRISDYGYRNNKIIPQESSDIVVAFFPIDRFLTRSLRNVFLDSPALFFNPLMMVIDPNTKKLLKPILQNVYGSEDEVNKEFKLLLQAFGKLNQPKIADARAAVAADQAALTKAKAAIESDQAAIAADNASPEKNASALAKHNAALKSHEAARDKAKADLDNDQKALDSELTQLKASTLFGFLSTLSLNHVHIAISGVMTVDELTVPSTLEATCFDKAGADVWAIAGDKTCTITGRFLSSGVPKIPDAAKLGISDIAVNKDASTDDLLKFTFKLKAPLDPPVEFDILVSKDGKNGKTAESMKYHVSSTYTLGAPKISSVTQKDNTATVTGTNFYSSPNNLFKALVRPALATDDKSDVAVKTTAAETSTSFTLDTSAFDKKVTPGCYLTIVTVGTMTSGPSNDKKDKLRVNAAPKITSAKWTTTAKTAIEATGEQFIGTKDCGGTEPEFELLLDDQKTVAGKSTPLTSAKGDAGKMTFPLPSDIGDKKAAYVRIKGSTDAPVKIQ
jgi:hypothetical protein